MRSNVSDITTYYIEFNLLMLLDHRNTSKYSRNRTCQKATDCRIIRVEVIKTKKKRTKNKRESDRS